MTGGHCTVHSFIKYYLGDQIEEDEVGVLWHMEREEKCIESLRALLET